MKCSEIGSLVEDSAFISPSILMKPKKFGQALESMSFSHKSRACAVSLN